MAMKARMPGGARNTITSLAVVAQTLLPTPQADDRTGAKTPEQVTAMRARGYGVSNLNEAVVNDLLPTPRASANENRQTKRTPSQEAGEHGLCLAAEVLDLLPTPRVSGGSDIMKPPPSTLTGSHGLDLGPAIGSLLPTPCVADGTGGHKSRSGDRSGELMLPGIARELSDAMKRQSDGMNAPSGAPSPPL